MNRLHLLVRRVVVLGFVLSLGGLLAAQELGTITFPNSGAPAAQAAFLEGVKSLHSFQFDEAAEAFKRAQTLDPGFALAYWGEAMSYNHPLWAQQDTEAAKKTLEKIAPTFEGRVAKAPTPKEKAYLEAANILFYSPGDKLTRDQAYSDAMARFYAQWPDDHEIATFYALSLLGTIRPGDAGFRRQALAASIVERVFRENPNHPGAAHFIIHSFDDPDHAPLALDAANMYAKIAPSAPHALHMPSHIYVQRGMWQEVAASNTVAYKAARQIQARMKLPEGREDFHTLSWLLYANLMLGQLDEARANLQLAKEAADRNSAGEAASRIRSGYLGMRARYILETAQWEKIPLETSAAHGGDHAGMPGMAMPQYGGNLTWVFIAGVSAAKMNDPAAADAAETHLRGARQKLESEGNAYDAKSVAIMEKEVGALSRLARGQKDEAVRLAKEAADIELTMSAPSGPPDPIKPALELYGEVLLEADRAKEAAAAFEQSLLRTPKRTPSVLGLARASAKLGNMTTARQSYQELAAMAGMSPSAPAVQEAQKFLKTSHH
jgi:tetratricopeptide (TPR) repeat protein